MRIALSALLFIAGTSWARGTAAQSEPGGESYEQLLKKGEAAVIARDWKACVENFEQARDLRPDDPLVYLAIGRCSLEDGDNIRALRNLKKGMQQQSLSDRQRARAESLLKRASQRVGVFTFKLSPGSAEMTVAGEPLQLDEDGRKLLEVGRYPVTVSAEGYRTLMAEIQVTGGENRELEYKLQPVPAPQPEATAAAPVTPQATAAAPVTPQASTSTSTPAAPPPSPPSPPLERSEETGAGFPVVPVVVAGIGGALLIGATVTGALALSEQSELEDKCRDNVCDPSLETTKESADTLATVTDVLWVSGVLTVGTAVLLHLVLPGEESEPADVAAVIGPSEAGLAVNGRF